MAFGDRTGPFLLVCEHASQHIPAHLNNLGLAPAALDSHIAWDPGAGALTRQMARRLDAPVVAGTISRLVYDCNRPPDATDAIPDRSESYAIPGNTNLSAADKAERIAEVYTPFRDRLATEIAKRAPKALITVHSFTPIYDGTRREVQIGVLHGTDPALAQAMMDQAQDHSAHIIRLNQPYSQADGVTHTLDLYGAANDLPNVMIEVRNDLLQTADAQAQIADLLCPWLIDAMASLPAEAQQ
ncbi:N-formylglutamate amidohydrolase [Actibacterium sp. 188UL27-1]|uniref:N-formylglutamate amidohydrolase n=1 Tax=Actibacterium sp. 188UL27-1 TaxID=2786961 RepID=UPI00351C2B60